MLRAEMTCETPDYWAKHFLKHGIENPPAFYEPCGPGMAKIASLNAHIFLDVPRDFEKQYPSFEGQVPALVDRVPASHKDENGEAFGCYFDHPDAPETVYLEAYGVIDSPEQFRSLFGEKLEADPREFFVTFTEIRKDEEPERDGWRWEKWGSYYGTQNSRADYIYDEPEIESVYIFHIYEL